MGDAGEYYESHWVAECRAMAGRAERAEAAISSVRALTDPSRYPAYVDRRLILAALEGTDPVEAAPGDRSCGKCGTANIVWFTPDNELWNRVQEATGEDVLCVTCFVRTAEDVLKVVPPAWMVSPEPRPESEGRWVWQASDGTHPDVPAPEERSEECPYLADVLSGRARGPHSDTECGWCADIRRSDSALPVDGETT